ncbi:MAG: phage tail sheath family protein, partial [Chitinophagaceae bacterium]
MPHSPGIYIEENPSALPMVKEVNCSIPVFIGYTQKAGRRGKSLLRVPVKINSFKEYVSWFGDCFKPRFIVSFETAPELSDFISNHKTACIRYAPNTQLYMYRAVELFFANGGHSCYVLSTGLYGHKT